MYTFTAEEVAEKVLHRTLKSFQNRRRELKKAGFPEPLKIPGHPLWLASDIQAWLESRRAGATGAEQAAEKVEPSDEAYKAPEAPAMAAKRGPGRPRKLAAGGAQ